MKQWGVSAFFCLASCLYYHRKWWKPWLLLSFWLVALIDYSNTKQLSLLQLSSALDTWPSLTTRVHLAASPKDIPDAVRGTLCFLGGSFSGLGSWVLMLEGKGFSEALSSETDIWLWVWFSCPGKEIWDKRFLSLLLGILNHLSNQEQLPERLYFFFYREKW